MPGVALLLSSELAEMDTQAPLPPSPPSSPSPCSPLHGLVLSRAGTGATLHSPTPFLSAPQHPDRVPISHVQIPIIVLVP